MEKEKLIYEALGNVYDPDLKKDLVSLNMVKNVSLENHNVAIDIILTTPACPLKDKLREDIETSVQEVLGEGYTISVNFDATVTSPRAQNEQILSGIKNIIAVASGKGGVGKSTMAVNLAISLSQMGAKTGLLDADIHGPSVPTLLNLENQKPGVYEEKGKVIMEPMESCGIKALSIGLLVDEKQPLVWRGPMASSALRQLFVDANWGNLDYLVVDLPPGTGDIHLTMLQQFPVSGAVVVTTPQKVAIADVKKCIEMFRMPQINVPILGIIENMAYFVPEEMPDHKYFIFGKGGGENLAKAYNLPLLGQIPIAMGIAEDADKGIPAMTNEKSLLKPMLEKMAQSVAQHLAIVNSIATEKAPAV